MYVCTAGRVRATLQFEKREAAPLLLYRGVEVTADQAVQLQSGAWRRVANAPGSSPLAAAGTTRSQTGGEPLLEDMVYDLITARHRLRVVGSEGETTLFADYEETDDSERELCGFLKVLENEERKSCHTSR